MWSQILTALFLILTVYYGIIWFRRRKLVDYINKMPGPKIYPIVGNFTEFWSSPEGIFKKLRELSVTYYPFYRYWIFNMPVFNIISPEDIEILMGTKKHSRKSEIYFLLHPWLGTGLLTSEGKKWQHRRKILTPAFHFTILQKFFKIFSKHSLLLKQRIEEECNKPFTDISPIVSQFTLHAICETAMGTQLDDVNEQETYSEYQNAIFRIGELLVKRLINPWFYNDWMYKFSPRYWEQKKLLKKLHGFTRNVISQRELSHINDEDFANNVEETEEDDIKSKKTRLAMLDLLFSVKNSTHSIDNEGIREEVDTFTFEGHDTTAACISFTLLLLANHKAVQDQIYQEILDVFTDLSKPARYEDIQKLTYLEQVIKESLRLYPSVPFISRVTDSEVQLHSGYVLPKEAIIQIHIFDLHHNESLYPDPYKFDPERFSVENAQKRHPFAYIPFSAGPRNCIGKNFAMLELKTVLCEIIKNFVIDSVDKVSDIVLIPHLVLKAQVNLKVKFRKRDLNLH